MTRLLRAALTPRMNSAAYSLSWPSLIARGSSKAASLITSWIHSSFGPSFRRSIVSLSNAETLSTSPHSTRFWKSPLRGHDCICVILRCLLGQHFNATDDVEELLGDLLLTHLVTQQRELLDDVGGGVRGVAHRDHLG